MNNKLWNKWFVIVVIMMFLGILIWGYSATPVASMADQPLYSYFNEGWSQQIDGELFVLEDIRDFYPVELGEPLTFVCTLPEIEEGNVLLFYSKNQEVSCRVDGELIQEFVMDDQFAFLKTPGSAWNQIDLDSSMSGKICTLTLCSQLSDYNNRMVSIFFLNNVEVDGLRINFLWFYGIVTVVVLILGVVTLVSGVVWKRQQRKRYFFSLSCLYFFMAFWLMAALNFFDFFFGRPIMSYLLGEYFVRLIPFGVVVLAQNSTAIYDKNPIFDKVKILCIVNCILPWILQFTMGISLLETSILNKVTFIIVALSIVSVIVKKIRRFKSLEPEEYLFLVLGVLAIGGIVDMIILCCDTQYFTFSGIWTVASSMIYTVVVFLVFALSDARQGKEKEEIEQSYHRLQNTSLVQQMKVHFIFNVLNAISAFCKEDAAKADRAIQKFAKYLRSYLRVINEEENIPIDLELDMVENYLIIEQMRFEDKLSFVVDMKFEDFDVPPLSVQTLVENAVVHGIQKQTVKGKVIVTTRKNGNFAEVIVSDTGAGFDINLLTKNPSVGLSNLKKRLRIMSNGTYTITSKVGQGTRVIMMIPLDYM